MNEIIKKYVRWIDERILCEPIGDYWFKLSVPYLDRHNDWIAIYLKKENNRYFITDDGTTLQDLLAENPKIDKGKRRDILLSSISGLSIDLNGQSLEVFSLEEELPFKINNLIQAISIVSNLFYLSPSSIEGIFREDVENWLNENEIRFTSKVSREGKSGYAHSFDFVIPKSKEYPERFLQAVNKIDKNSVEIISFKWLDIESSRGDSKAYAFLNDSQNSIKDSTIKALRSYDITPIVWSKREQIKKELVA